MSHIFNAKNGTEFVHNGDFSGNVVIYPESGPEGFSIPFEDLADFVAKYVRQNRIAELERASTEKLLEG
jgi:hypothetical protein